MGVNQLTFVIFSLMAGSSLALNITYFDVPRFVEFRTDVELKCMFAMSVPSETLHSVKWYRNDPLGRMQEFYSYQPKRNPPAKIYKRKGIRIDMRQSNVNSVVLRRVTLDTSGKYRCEVTSKKAWGIDVKVETGRMEVVAISTEKPVISGGQMVYKIGDPLELNCTSSKTFPPTRLKWLINGNELDSSNSIDYPLRQGDRSGLFRSRIGLETMITRSLLRFGKIRIECVGEVESEGVLHGWSEAGGSRQVIETIRLPEALKREQSREVFMVPMTSSASSLMESIRCAPLAVISSFIVATTFLKH